MTTFPECSGTWPGGTVSFSLCYNKPLFRLGQVLNDFRFSSPLQRTCNSRVYQRIGLFEQLLTWEQGCSLNGSRTGHVRRA